MDNELMPGMVESQKPLDGYSTYGQTSNIHDAANLFKFAADNSIVEWKLDVYENEMMGQQLLLLQIIKKALWKEEIMQKKGRL